MKTKIKASQCFECKHFHENKSFTCEAFPEGIPDVILYTEVSHKRPFTGDNGIQFEEGEPLLTKAVNESDIEPVDPPEESVKLQRFSEENLSLKQALKISQKLRKTYAKQLNTRAFGEMENAILNYDAARNLAIVNKQIVGAISYYYDDLAEVIYLSHIGTVNAPKGTGAELMRTVVDAAFGGGVGMHLESTSEAKGFYLRLGFKRNMKTSYEYFIFDADYKRVRQIKEALGSTGRVKEQTGE